MFHDVARCGPTGKTHRAMDRLERPPWLRRPGLLGAARITNP
jgi:hypothetical protein